MFFLSNSCNSKGQSLSHSQSPATSPFPTAALTCYLRKGCASYLGIRRSPLAGNVSTGPYLDSFDIQGCQWPVDHNNTDGFEVVVRNSSLGRLDLAKQAKNIMDLPWLADAMQKTIYSGVVNTGTLIQWLNANLRMKKISDTVFEWHSSTMVSISSQLGSYSTLCNSLWISMLSQPE